MKTIKFTRHEGGCPSVEYNGTVYYIDERELRTSFAGWYLLGRKKTQVYNLHEVDQTGAVVKAQEMLESLGYEKPSFFNSAVMHGVPCAPIRKHSIRATAYVFHNGENYDLRIVFPEWQQAGPFNEFRAAMNFAGVWIESLATQNTEVNIHV